MASQQSVNVSYTVTANFPVPADIDLDDEDQVKDYFLCRDGTLRILLRDGETITLRPASPPKMEVIHTRPIYDVHWIRTPRGNAD